MTDKKIHLGIVGAGPAGLSAAIYAASEGFDVDVYERNSQVGGQMACSVFVENYPGRASGVNGCDLAENMKLQAETFGARIHLRHDVWDATWLERMHDVVILATGSSEGEELPLPEGDMVTYLPTSDQLTEQGGKKNTIVVGGGNGGCQAALWLSETFNLYRPTLVTSGSIGDNCSAFMKKKIENAVLANRLSLYQNSQVISHFTLSGRVFLVLDVAGNPANILARKVLVYRAKKLNAELLQDFDEHKLDKSRMYTAGELSGSVSRIGACVGSGAEVISRIQRDLNEREQSTGSY